MIMLPCTAFTKGINIQNKYTILRQNINSPQAALIQYETMPNGPGNHNLANYGHISSCVK